MSYFPNSFLPFPVTPILDGEIIHDDHVSGLYEELSGVEVVLGTGVQGGYSTVRDRLDALGVLASGYSNSGFVVGPASATSDAVALYNGTTGKIIKDSSLLYSSSTLTFPTNAVIRESGLRITGVGDIVLNPIGTVILSGADMLPGLSGVGSLGSGTKPFAKTYSNQYATTLVSGAGAQNTTIDWNNGTSQVLNWIGVAGGGYNVLLSNGIAGSAYVLETIQNNSGTCSITWSGSNIAWQAGISGLMTSTSGVRDMFSFWYDGSKYLGTFSNNYF